MSPPPYPAGFRPPERGFWTFAYGSLMWQPDCRVAERRMARLYGYHRALCVYSWVYRGTQAKPGLVFGLDRGGAVNGIALRIADADAVDAFQAIYAREMVTAVYRPLWAECRFTDGTRQRALTFVAATENEQYAGRLSEDETERLVRQGVGSAGPCTDYVLNTADHLKELGIADRRLTRIARRLAR